ncbi:MAG: thiamine pyrophosphate-dependent dehydrogenase E1 component subunit alpha [Planctomycetia bacterium]|nr:thiamine pyrophosphate-dependent dehydrogenase E1 component subunit alpha [Planctomycetia bacterium]
MKKGILATEELLNIYEMMNLIRDFEMQAVSFFEGNVLRGSVHLCIGQEATPASVCQLLRPDDYISSTHRGHGHCLAKGADPGKAMAELMGKDTGYCRGRGGSMHIADVESGNLGANAIVAGGVAIAVGAALASQMQQNGRVAVSFFGEGATNEGVFHEALNLASVWKLPVIFVCENNGYGISVPAWQSTSVKDVSQRAQAYDMEGVTVDGNDVMAILPVVKNAIDKARSGGGPTLIECKTYRWLGHWTGDPQPYRTREEVDDWKKKCPIKRMRKALLELGVSEKEIGERERKAKERIDAAADFALKSPEPDPAHVLDNVFFEEEGIR